jgi:hypothetical protein
MSDILWGAEEIGREANLLDENGDVDRRRVFYKLERGLLPAKKNGREWEERTRMGFNPHRDPQRPRNRNRRLNVKTPARVLGRCLHFEGGRPVWPLGAYTTVALGIIPRGPHH